MIRLNARMRIESLTNERDEVKKMMEEMMLLSDP